MIESHVIQINFVGFSFFVYYKFNLKKQRNGRQNTTFYFTSYTTKGTIFYRSIFYQPCIVAQRLSIEVLVYTRRVKIRFPLRRKKHFYFLALVTRLSAVLSSTTQHALSRKLGETWGMECPNTKLPLPTLRCAPAQHKTRK